MKNFIFISPNFPANYWLFCRELKADGINVLGIGDQPYGELSEGLRESLSEYYKVDDLEDYGQVYRGAAFLAFKRGKIDWLERDAQLRADFHITTGFQPEDMPRVKYKSRMKEYYAKAGIPAAQWHLVDGKAGCMAFIERVGWPVVAKPDNGVGASDTHRLTCEAELDAFLEAKNPAVPYIMEEFVHAEINSYDAVIDSRGEPVFETGNVTPSCLMDVVNLEDNCIYYIVKDLSEDVRRAGRAAVKSFGVKSRFVHFEFFRLTQDQKGLGKRGDVVALEVNMRPCGGFSPDMMNFANTTDVYKIWADMIAYDRSTLPVGEHAYCAFAGRRDGKKFALSHEAVLEKYGAQMKMVERLPDVLAAGMGNQMYVALFPEREEMERFYQDVLESGT